MENALLAMILKPWVIGLLVSIAAFSAFSAAFRDSRRESARKAYWTKRKKRRDDKATSWKIARVVPSKGTSERSTLDAAEQLRRVMEAEFKARPLLNKPERRLLAVIDEALAAESPGWRAMGQVALGEVLWSDNKDAYWAINAKRVDLLIVDCECQPLYAVEFQGTGHHLGRETAARDAAKKEALRRAGIGYIEVVSGDTPTQVRETIRRLVSKSC